MSIAYIISAPSLSTLITPQVASAKLCMGYVCNNGDLLISVRYSPNAQSALDVVTRNTIRTSSPEVPFVSHLEVFS